MLHLLHCRLQCRGWLWVNLIILLRVSFSSVAIILESENNSYICKLHCKRFLNWTELTFVRKYMGIFRDAHSHFRVNQKIKIKIKIKKRKEKKEEKFLRAAFEPSFWTALFNNQHCQPGKLSLVGSALRESIVNTVIILCWLWVLLFIIGVGWCLSSNILFFVP